MKPLLQIAGYYVVVAVVVAGLLALVPGAAGYLPVGGVSELSGGGVEEFVKGTATTVSLAPATQAIRLAISLSGVVLTMLPVAWIYMGVRRRKGKEQSFLATLLMLPLAVAAIVLIVQNSLALAFSLAGIVAGVRFRLTLEDTLDAVYVFLAIGVGLAAGIEALEIAVVLSVFFNGCILLLWRFEFAETVSTRRWFARSWMTDASEDNNDPSTTRSASDDPAQARDN